MVEANDARRLGVERALKARQVGIKHMVVPVRGDGLQQERWILNKSMYYTWWRQAMRGARI
jgi:hypothetical protein